MKNSFLLLSISLGILFSCSSENQNTNGTCNGGANLCFDLSGNTISGNAYWYELLGSKMCVFLTDGVKEVSIDIGQLMDVQDFTIVNGSLYSQSARITYTDKQSMPYVEYKAISGTLSVTEANFTNNTVSGIFNGVMQNQSTQETFTVANGKFINIPHQ